MKDIDILIFIEHVDRELKGAIEVKKILQSKTELDVKIFSLEFGFYDAWMQYNPKLICLPYCKSEQNLVVRAFKTRNPNTVFLNLSYEQILNKTTERYKAPRDEFARKELYYFAWGNLFKEYLIRYGVPEEKISVVGKPEIQFLKQMKMETGNELKGKLAKELGLSMEKKWMFLPLNDGAAFRDVDLLKRRIAEGTAFKESLISHDYCFKQIRVLLEWLFQLYKDGNLDDYEIIWRPHPGVDISKYQEILDELKIENFTNLHIIRNHTVKEWLCCSDICVTNWSTVLIDAASIGLKAYVFEHEPLAPCLDAEWLRWFESINTRETMKKILVSDETKNYEKEERADVFFNTEILPTEAWANSMVKVLGCYKETNLVESFAMVKALKKEYRRLIRSKLRTLSRKTRIGKRYVNNKIEYDYFEPIL